MIELNFPLNITIDSPRPIFNAFINGTVMKCMLDTGADMPVFCKGAKLFEKLAKGMNETAVEFKKSFIGGFGQVNESAMLWHMDDFRLSDRKHYIHYKSMKIAVLNKPNIPCDIILSASMFMKMRYIIDCSSKKHTLTIMAD